MSDASTAILEERDAAMTTLREALASAVAGRGRLVVVSGDAGIGKSSVAAAITAEAEAAGADVQWGRAWEFADAPPYFPVRGALRALGIDPHDVAFRDEGGSFRLWEAVVGALAKTTRPVAWVLEDLHAADLLTLDLLTFLGHAVRALRVLVVATTRAKDPRLDERSSQRLTRMARDGVDVRLGPLGASSVGAVAARVCGGPLPSDVVHELAELTGGNPLFVVECARAYKATGTVASLPPTVRDVVIERFSNLPDETRGTLAYGSVLGREFSAALVGRMRRALPARVIDALLSALRSGLVVELEPGRFAFSHVIVRDAIEETLGAEERARAHALAEEALAASGSSTDVLVERARHALAAASLGDGERAIELARRAIHVLDRDGAYDRAFALCEKLSASSAALESASALSAEDGMTHARIARSAGRHAESRRLCDRVLSTARASGDATLFAQATLMAGAEIRPAFVDRSLLSLLEEARAMLGTTESGLACRLEARLAAALQPHEDPEVPIAMAREAIARARSLDDDVLLDVLDMAVAALVDFAPVDERIAAYEEIAERASTKGDRPKLLRAHARLALDHAFIGDFESFSRDVDASLRLAADLGHPRFRWRALLMSSMRAVAQGDLTESERAIVEVTELAAVTDDPALAMSLGGHRLYRAILLHDDRALRATLDDLPRMFAAFGVGDALSSVYRAVIFARLEDEPAAHAALAAAGAERHFFERETSGAALIAEAVALAGTDDDRRRIHALLEPHAHLESIGGHVPISYDGPVARALALLDASLGDIATAERRLTEAVERATKRGHRTWIAQMEYDLARILASSGQPDRARPHAETAAALAAEIGIDDLAARARAVGRGASDGAPPPSAAAAPAAMPAPQTSLTLEREGDVWRVTHGDRTFCLRDSRGVQLLARLVDHADEEVHVLALASDEGGASVAENPTGDALDERALRAYRERLKDLDAEIDQAERDADAGRLDKLRRESEMLKQELARAVGLGGRTRQGGSATERARVNVQRRLKDAIARAREADPTLGAYLDRAVRTGTFCCYRP